MNVISVKCPSGDGHLHLAPYEPGLGTSIFTLCLQRWTERETAREGFKLCPVCLEKWQFKSIQESIQGAQQ